MENKYSKFKSDEENEFTTGNKRGSLTQEQIREELEQKLQSQLKMIDDWVASSSSQEADEEQEQEREEGLHR